MSRHAGVSTKTVSRVLNGEPHVTEELRERVMAAASALSYHPNVLAQALVRRRSHLIGLVYENPSPSYVVELQRGVLDRLEGSGYRLVVVPVPLLAQNGGEMVRILRSAALDGVVLAPPASDDAVILRELAAAHILFARVAPTRLFEAGPGTMMDDVGAGRQIARYLIDLGHRDIAVITGAAGHASGEDRLRGYAQAFRDAGLTLRADRIEPGAFTYESGLAAGRRLLARPGRPTAILAQNDDMAVGAMMAAREAGLTLPEDLSVVGFDDSAIARTIWPKLTTIRQPVFEMAATAATMLIGLLEGETPEWRHLHGHELLIRDSAAPPRPA